MESGDVSEMTAPRMKLVFRGDLSSATAMSGFKWSLVLLIMVFSAWRPATASTLTGKTRRQRPVNPISLLFARFTARKNTVMSN